MSIPSANRLHLALGLLSITVVAFQLVLMQILSLTQWHHFAYLVISIALLGFGAAGTVLALARQWFLRRLATLLPLLMLAAAAATTIVVPLCRDLLGGFDTYLLFVDPSHFGRLLTVSLFFALPFFLIALAIGLIFVRWTTRIGPLYFANLAGSGIGGLIAILLLEAFPVFRLPPATALFALAAGCLLLPRRSKFWLAAAAAATIAAWFLAFPASLPLSPYKDLDAALRLPGARTVALHHGPVGRIDIVRSAALRPAGDLSLTFSGAVPQRDMVFVNGNARGPAPLPPTAADESLLHFTSAELPYAFGLPRRALVLGAGTGNEVAHALLHGAPRVVAVEAHDDLTTLLRNSYPKAAGRIFGHRDVELQPVAPRSFLATDDRRFDLIVIPELGSFGGIAGLTAVHEQPLLTRQGLSALWRHLRPDGLLCMTVWLDHPPRVLPRLLATLVETLETAGVAPRAHIAAIRNWAAVTLCVKRSPLTPADTAAVRSLCRRLQFDPLLLPDLGPEEREHFHRLQDKRLFSLLDALFAANRQDLYHSYPFRIRPPTDESPFFSQFLRPATLPELFAAFGARNVPFVEMGYLVVLVAFVQMSLAGIILILLPLTRLGWRRGGRLPTFLYFGSLGCGFMLVEMVFIHRFTVYLGHPVYAAALVIGVLLLFSGCGSYASGRYADHAAAPSRSTAAVALFLLCYLFLLPLLLDATVGRPLAVRSLLCLLILAPPSLAMGFPFPLGLQALSRNRPQDVPWAWGINGCLSVIATALATIVAIEAGFSVVLLIAAAFYGLASLVGGKLKPAPGQPQ